MKDTQPEPSSLSSVSDYEDANEALSAAFIKKDAPFLQSSQADVPTSGALWLGGRQNSIRVPRVILTRTIKSVVLVAKVCLVITVGLQHFGGSKFIPRRCFPSTKYAVTMVLYFSKPWPWDWLSSTLGLIAFTSLCYSERSTWSYFRFFVDEE